MIRASLLLVSLVSFYATGASADTKDEIARLADQIRSEARSSRASSRELETARDLLENSLRILRGGEGPSHGIRFGCTSRDNDDRAPFILVGRDRDLNAIRFETIRFKTAETCNASVDLLIKDVSAAYVCYSRDGDDANPWVLGSVTSDRSTKELAKFRDQSACFQTLRDSWVERAESGISFCASRDGDDQSPWTLVRVRAGSSSVVEQFSSYESCAQVLGRR